MKRLVLLGLVAPILCGAVTASAANLLVNGGFETGNFSGWTTTNTGNGGTFVSSSTVAPLSGLATAGPKTGTFYGLTDQTGPGVHAFAQTFTVPVGTNSLILSFDMFVTDWDGGPFINPAGLDYTASPNEHGRVDLLDAGALPLTTTTGVVQNLYIGADLPVGTNYPYTSYTFDLTSSVTPGNTYTLRFAEVDNQLFFNMGVDNVVLDATVVPLPAAVWAGLSLLAGMGAVRTIRRKARSS